MRDERGMKRAGQFGNELCGLGWRFCQTTKPRHKLVVATRHSVLRSRLLPTLAWLLIPMLLRAAERTSRLEFTRMLAHWSDYADPGYLSFVEDTRAELVQLGFYGAHFWGLSDTPHGKGYPANLPVQGH